MDLVKLTPTLRRLDAYRQLDHIAQGKPSKGVSAITILILSLRTGRFNAYLMLSRNIPAK